MSGQAELNNLTVGSFFGIKVKLHWTWLLLFLFLLFADLYQAGIWLCLFGFVLLHEFGHCFASQYYNRKVIEVVLHPLGGAAVIEIPKKPLEEYWISAAGPLVNVGLILPLELLGQHYPYFKLLSFYNFSFLLFNLLPIFPLDGGRMFRAGLCYMTGDYPLATCIAVRFGQIIAILLGLYGIYYFQFVYAIIAAILVVFSEIQIVSLKTELDLKDDIWRLKTALCDLERSGAESEQEIQILKENLKIREDMLRMVEGYPESEENV